MEQILYTQQQLDIKLLQSKNDDTGQTLRRIESRLDSIENRLDTTNAHIKNQYGQFTSYILGIYGIILCAVLAHLKGVF